MSQARCPRCSSPRRCEPYRVRGLPFHYTCRDVWHMPSLQSDAEEALTIVAGLDSLVSGEPLLSAETLDCDPHRHATSEYPQ